MKMLVGVYLLVLKRVHHMDRLNPIQDFNLVFLLMCFIFTLSSVLLLPMHAGFRLHTAFVPFCHNPTQENHLPKCTKNLEMSMTNH